VLRWMAQCPQSQLFGFAIPLSLRDILSSPTLAQIPSPSSSGEKQESKPSLGHLVCIPLGSHFWFTKPGLLFLPFLLSFSVCWLCRIGPHYSATPSLYALRSCKGQGLAQLHSQGQARHGGSGGRGIQTGRVPESWFPGAGIGGRGLPYFSELPALGNQTHCQTPRLSGFPSE
jgi:hypothetical protein